MLSEKKEDTFIDKNYMFIPMQRILNQKSEYIPVLPPFSYITFFKVLSSQDLLICKIIVNIKMLKGHRAHNIKRPNNMKVFYKL